MIAPSLVLAALTAVGLVVPRLVEPLTRRADPRVTAGIAVLALADLAVLPLVWLACLSSGVPVPGLSLAAACWPALGSATGRRLEHFVVVVLLAALAGCTVAAVRRGRAAEPRGLTLAACRHRPLPGGGCALVLPATEPLAYVAGFLRPRIVVSAGLLATLSPTEQDAVLAHETAHLRLGHARLLTVGSALASTYRWLPGIRRVWTLLCRELEAAADDAAVRTVGPGPLLSALARVTLVRSQPAAAGFNDLDAATLRYRIERLRTSRPTTVGRSPAALFALTLAAALSWSGCALATHPNAAGLLGCALAAGWLAIRPSGGARVLRRDRPGSIGAAQPGGSLRRT
jgi:hypothetical protein